MSSAQTVAAWWPLARSEEVNAKTPLAVRCGDDEIVLYRDAAGQPLALEDRCAHRRVPLSAGRITPEGWLQCGYHGWCYDGVTGACAKIPNMRPEERISPRYRVEPYRVREDHGFVHVWIGAAPAGDPPDLPEPAYRPAGREYQGTAVLPLAHDEFIAALLDGPEVVLDLTGVRPANWPLGDPVSRGDLLTMDRAAKWSGPSWPDAYTYDFPLFVRTALFVHTGEAVVEVRLEDHSIVSSALIASAPTGRGATAVRWRSFAPAGAKGLRAAMVRGQATLGTPPISVRPHIDGEALSKIVLGPSLNWRDFRQNLNSAAA